MRAVLLVAAGLGLTLAVFLANPRYRGIPAVARAEDDLKIGERVYQENCAACHSEKGDGKGPLAERLKTKPRDFTIGIYKFSSTPSGSLPLDEDIFRTISRGVRGTSMLAQLQLSERERWAVVQYVKTFSKRFKEEKPGQAVAGPPAPPPNAKLIALGRSKYEEAGCAQCHGADGKGHGPSAKDLKDDWGNPISAADLTLKPFKSGPNPEDLYRTISTGLNGTPMPSYAAAFSPNERWALVSYVLSIATKEKPRGMMGLVGEEVDGMRIDMRAAMAGMMGGRGMMGRGGGMMNGKMKDMMKDMMGK
jgi:cytochrome c oxidase cbb3-type subunit 2